MQFKQRPSTRLDYEPYVEYEEISPRPKRRFRLGQLDMLRTTGNMLLGAGSMLLVVVGVGVWKMGDRFFTSVNQFLNPPAPQPQVDVKTVVVEQVRGASELTTAVFNMQAVVPTSQNAAVSGFVIGTTKLLYIAHGEIQAGVDLSQVTADKVQVVGDSLANSSITITLPPPKVLNSKLDVSRSGVYDYNRGFLNLGPDTAPQLQKAAQEESLRQIVRAACNSGMMAQASDRAKLTITQLLGTAGFKNVVVNTPTVTPEACISEAQKPISVPQVQLAPGGNGVNGAANSGAANAGQPAAGSQALPPLPPPPLTPQ